MSGNQHILIVDDQIDNLIILEDLLSDQYVIHTATNGEEALVYLDSGGMADLIVSDIRMPGLTGFELCERIKAISKWQSVPLVFLSGLITDEDRDFALSIGAAGFILKPFSLQTVLDEVSSYLGAA